jgi:hypothetical protein
MAGVAVYYYLEVQLERRLGSKAGIALGVFMVAGLSLLCPKDGGLWQGLATAPSAWEPGWLGLLLWQWAYGAFGIAGIYALRATLAALLSWLILAPRAGEEAGEEAGRDSSFAGRLACALGLALLLPWGPGALFFPMAALVLALASRWPLLAFLAAFAWPFCDGSFLVGGLVSALAASAPGNGGWWLAVAPLLNPAGLGALLSGQAFLPFAASWTGFAGYAAAMPNSPAFYLAAFWAIATAAASLGGSKDDGRGQSPAPTKDVSNRAWRPAIVHAALVAAILGMALRPLSGLPAFLRPRLAGKGPGLASLLVTLPLAIWFLASPRPEGLPGQAVALLRSLPQGAWTLQTTPAWSGELALDFGASRMRPRFETGALWDSRKRYPAGLAPPFEGSPQPEADVILLKPSYPKDPFPQKLRPGWNLVAAGTNYALFAKETPLLSGWIGKNRLSFYNPYSILPDGFEPRRKALDEALRLLEGDPRFFQALRDAGRMETDFQLPDAAARHLRKAVEIAPKDSELWNDLGAALQIGGDQKGAMEAYGRSLDLKPSELLPRFNMASLLLQAGRPQDAEEILKAVIVARPRAYIAYRRLAQVLVSEGKRDEAKEVLAKIPSDMRLPEDEDILGGAK